MTADLSPSSQAREWLECIRCQRRYGATEVVWGCACGGLLSVERAAQVWAGLSTAHFDARRASRDVLDQSGVWRFREGVMEVAPERVVTHPEGNTRLYQRAALSRFAGVESLFFKHEGENPTGSFKDRGMTAAMTQAVRVGARAVACASTGNTSSSLAAYAAHAGLPAIVFLPSGKISASKLAQTLAYGARCLQVKGDFDRAMQLADTLCARSGVYLLNSKNPFRIEGQKTIVWELLQDLGWEAPDWIALPAGNLGNTSAFGKALLEAHRAGWISKLPRLLCVQAHGANPFFRSFQEQFARRHKVQAETVASAIRIGDPVSYEKARAAVELTHGEVCEVTDEALLWAKREIDFSGLGCEPASACSLAGVKLLRAQGRIREDARVVCVLTGNVLKDTDAIERTRALEPQGAQLRGSVVEVGESPAEVEAALRRVAEFQ